MKSNFFRYLLVAGFLLCGTFSAFSQVKNDFGVRYENNIRGEITFIANNIVNRKTWNGSSNDPYNTTGWWSSNNDNLDMQYIDIDNDPNTFSSSSASLAIPDLSCAKVRYAALYWSAVYNVGTRQDFRTIKFKTPGGTYQSLTADDVLFDGNGDTDFGYYAPYACYKDVTPIVTGLADPNGEYFVADMRASSGSTISGGVSGGWTMVVVYENPNLPGKYITTFDGYAGIKSGASLDIPVDGFTTLPSPFPVNAKIGVATLEGDNNITGDGLSIKANSRSAFTALGNTVNPTNNFFNANITLGNAIVTTRNPNSENTLGWDVDMFTINNPTNSVIPNDETGAVLRASSTQDKYDIFFTSFDVEIIEPIINLKKTVQHINGTDITGQGVNLGQELDYVLQFQNVGNDHAINYTIKDILPVNVTLNEANLSLPTGVTYTYDPATRTVLFTIPDHYVEKKDPAYTIRMRVKVAENCFDFVDACSDKIENLAYSTYRGALNDKPISEDPSVTDFDDCGFTTPGATNFLLDDLADCNIAKPVQLCGENVTLNAGVNFDEYIWYKDVNNNNIIDTGDTVIPGGTHQLTVTDIGTYIVDKKVADPCKGFTEIFEVERFGTTQTNPIVDWFNARNNDTDPTNNIQGEIAICPIDGSLLPKIDLCGVNDSQLIQINIADAQSMVWERLVEGSCTDAGDDCGNKNATCQWEEVSTGNTFTANIAGKFRLVINYQNGCFSRFYFNVFQNTLDFGYNSDDIYCTTPGKISITNLGAGYGFQLYDVTNNSIPVRYSDNNGPVFEITTNGTYRVGIMQLDNVTGEPIAGSCEFSTPDIGILDRQMDVEIKTKEADCNALGSITLQASNVRANYEYEIRYDDGSNGGDGSRLNRVTAQTDNNYTFPDLNPGNYIVSVKTDDGCIFTDKITVGEVPELTLSALVTADIGCSDGEITLTATGGKPVPGYSYAIWGKDGTVLYPNINAIPADKYKTDGNTFSFAAGEEGTYVFVVVDGNNCSALSNPVTIRNNGVLAATVSAVDVSCSGNGDGAINIVATGGVGPYAYSKDGGTSFQETPNFVGLAPGTYDIVVKDTSGCELTFTRTIAQPFPLSASAGVSRDASCDPDNGAEVRVTNVVGGTPTYTYSFDGGANYGTSSIQQLHPGSYTVIVKDARGCTFEMPVTVADIPAPPVVELTPEVSYDCIGEGIITVGTQSVADYDYSYVLLDSSGNVIAGPQPENVFSGVDSGEYTVRTIYKSQTPPTPSLLLREDFGSGETVRSLNTFEYDYEDQTVNPPGDNNVQINDGEYTVTSELVSPHGAWANPIDHTSGTRVGQGRYLVINIGAPGEGKIIYSKEIKDIIHNQPLQVSLWMLNLMKEGTNGSDVNLTVEVRKKGTGERVAHTTTGIIPKNKGNSDWVNPIIELDPGANSELDFVIWTNISVVSGNDVAIDDIEVFQIPEVCERIVDTPVIVEPNKMFEARITGVVHASCNGGTDGSITFEVSNFDPVAGFEYSLDGGTNWITSTSSPVSLPANLGSGTHTINIRKPNDNTPACNLELTEILTEPTEVEVEADITAEFMCSNGGATITASASGGTPGYEYQLEYAASVGGGIVPNYDFVTNGSNAIFEGLAAGEYVVRARDTRNCDDAISAVQTVEEPETLAFTATPTACYSGNSTGEITVTVTAGNGGYSFFINKGTGLEGPYQPDTATPTTYTFTNLGSGDYTIEVRDQFSCSVTSLPLAIAPELEVTASAPAITACANSTDITITATGGDGNYVYAVVLAGITPAPGDFSATNPVAVSAAGDYEVHVRDHDGALGFCSDVFPITIDKNDPITITPSVTHVSCFGASNGAISLTATGGNAPYRYSIDGGTSYQTTGDFPNLIAGTYTVVIEDADKCTETVDVEVTQPDPITAEAVLTTDYTCLPNGEAVITVGSITPTAGGSGNYEYSINGGAWTTSTVFNGLTNGTHTVRVRDANAVTCLITLPAIIIDPLPVAPTLSSTVAYNCDGTGNITITPFDSTYSYAIDGGTPQTGASANIFTNIAPGNHTITVNYGSMCTTDIVVNVAAGREFAASITDPVNNSCNAGSNGSFVINATHFDPLIGFAYSVNGVDYPGPFTTPQPVTGLTAQVYNVVVRDLRDANCAVPLTQELTQPAALTATASITAPFTCDNTGATITVEAEGGTPGYMYSLDGGTYQSSAIFRDVPAGTHTITVRDANQCEVIVTDPVIIATPEAPTFTVEPTACYTGNNDGTIKVDIDPLPGNGNFQFRINNGVWRTPAPATATTYTFTDLANNTYDIEVKDGFGCVSVQETVVLNPVIHATTSVKHVSSCADGSITVNNATGGDGNLMYAFVPAGTSVTTADFGTSNVHTVIEANAGDYDVYVWDNNATDPHCEYKETVTVNPATPLVITATPTDPICHDGPGSIAVAVTSGISLYTYELIDVTHNGAANTTTSNTINNTRTYHNLAPGDYTIKVTDATGCSKEIDVTINNPDELLTDVESILGANCDPATGFRFVNYTTGLNGTLQFSHDRGITWQTSDTFDTLGLTSGNAVLPSIRTVDASGNQLCRLDLPQYIITYPLDNLDITINAIIVDCNELQVSVQGSKGTAPYQYTYTDDPVNFNPAAPINPWTTPAQGLNDPYQFTGLIPGRTYVFYVRDNGGCVRQSEINVNDLIDLPLQITTKMEPSCDGANDGKITYTVTDMQAPLGTEFRWELFDMSSGTAVSVQSSGGNIPYSSPQDIVVENLAPGEYFIQVTEVAGGVDSCVSASENLLLEELDPIAATLEKIQDISCNAPGIIAINNITGGGGTYTFTVTGPAPFVAITETTDNPIEIPANSPAGFYNVVIKDQFGCEQDLGNVELLLTPNPTIDDILVDNCKLPNTITIEATSTAAEIFYSMDGGATYPNTDGIFTNVLPGTYNISIMDSNGCTDTDTVTIHPILVANADVKELMDCTNGTAEIAINITDGSGNYEYEITSVIGDNVPRQAVPSTSFIATVTVPDTYMVRIFDMGSDDPTCAREFPITVDSAVQPVFTETHMDVSCNGGTDGSITLSETHNDINPLTYTISPAVGTYNSATRTFEDLTAGSYTITGTGTNGCSTTIANIVITQPDPIAITAVDVTEFACTVDTNTSNNASITVTTVTGGSGNYTYEFVNNQGTADPADDVIVKARSGVAIYTETNRQGGSYTINVYDKNNCVGSTVAQILPYLEMTDITLDPTDPSCIPGADGTIKVDLGLSAALGTTDIQYDIEGLDVVYQDTYTGNVATHTFTGLGIGTYQITATNLVTKCVIIGIAELKDPNTFEVDIKSTTDVICYYTATGTATFSVTDPTYTGDYSWEVYYDNGTPLDYNDDVLVDNDNSSARLTTIGLAARDYYVSFTQVGVPVCENKKPFSIAGPDAALAATRVATDITCVPGNDGTIEITATGGWGGYRYYVSTTANPDPDDPANYLTTPKFKNLVAGTYEVWVIDSNECPLQLADVVLDIPDPITADLRINDHNCTNFEGEIEVINMAGGQGSNYSYQLQHWDGSGFVNTRPVQTTAIFSGLGAGRYQIVVSDQWGCKGTTTAAIDLYDVMVPKVNVVKLIDCMPGNEAGQITITQTGGVGPFTYTVEFPISGNLVSNNTGIFTGLDEVGEYTFTVTDAVGCSESIEKRLEAAIQPPTPVINDFEDVTCFGLANGTITVSVPNNGLDTYTFEITNKDGNAVTIVPDPSSVTNTSAKFTGLADGLYTITVTAVNGCQTTITQPITQPDELEIVTAPTVDPFECIVGNTTKYPIIDLDGLVTGGSGNYIRYVFVNDANPGVPVYDGPDSDYTVRDLAGGNYTITVYDDNGCSVQTTATLAPFVGISNPVISPANAGVTCAGDDEDITVSVDITPATASPNLTYTVVGSNGYNQTYPSTNSSYTFTDLGVGNYIITITNTDTGCSVKTTHEVKEPKVIEAVATVLTHETCLNDMFNGGSFSVAINNYIGGYDYQVFRADGTLVTGAGFSGSTDTTADNPLIIDNLPGGTYYVVITGTDHPYCPDTSTRVTINAPEAPISAVATEESNVSCDNDSGSILVRAAGGKGPYTITISDGAGQMFTQAGVYAHQFTGLSAGNFTVTVTDALGCTYTHNTTINLVRPDAITAGIESTELVCYGDTDGEVYAINISGGFGVKKYQLNVWDPTGAVIIQTSAPQWGDLNSNRFTNLPAGIYSITITDDANCGTETAKTEIVDPSDVRGDLRVDQTMGCYQDAIVVLTASGGTGPYYYSLTGTPGSYVPMGGGNTHSFTVPAGTYGVFKYYVQDDFGCGNEVSSSIEIEPIVDLSLTLDTSAAVINCNGESTATLIAKADGGLGNYRYELFTDAAFTQSVFGQSQASGTFSNLAAGDYYVRVTSEDCVLEEPTVIKIIEPTPLVVTETFEDESCSGARDGSITVELSGGSGDYQYAISPRLNRFDTVNTFTNLAPGTYTVIAQDKNGCFEQLEFTIAPATLLVATATSTPEICVGEEDGTIDLTITGGTGPYRTSINSMEDADFILGRTSFSGLAAGVYAVFVRDANDCQTYVAVEIEQGVNLNATVTPVYECTGDTPNNSIILALEDGTVAADVLYALDSTDPNDMVLEPNFTNLAPGNHFITIAHANGCERTVNFTIADFEPLVLTLEQRSLNQITAITTGGQAKYTYYFGDVNTGEKNTYYINKTGTYTVTVVDENGCESVADIYMEFVDIDIPNFFTPNGDGGNDTWKPKNQEGFPKILTIIFDRYGREVYRMGLNDGGWDGIYKGNELPTGDYWYVIKLKGENDDREFVGHFTLYR